MKEKEHSLTGFDKMGAEVLNLCIRTSIIFCFD
jgi:hypothetical protein